MPAHTVYLQSYDRYDEVLEYHYPNGNFAILSRQDFEALGVERTFGSFAREGQHIAGVFASPGGPVFFLDERSLVGRLGATSATVCPVPGGSKLQFQLMHEGTVIFSLVYAQRFGIGANPYDNNPEDIDLFALIAGGIGWPAFFKTYTREWAGNRGQTP